MEKAAVKIKAEKGDKQPDTMLQPTDSVKFGYIYSNIQVKGIAQTTETQRIMTVKNHRCEYVSPIILPLR